MKNFIDWIKARLRENSTWRGIALIAGSLLAMRFIHTIERMPQYAVQLADALKVIIETLILVGGINIIRKQPPPADPGDKSPQ